jgi:hypothetical protein
MEGVNSRTTYCKNFCKRHNVLPVQQNKQINKRSGGRVKFEFPICYFLAVDLGRLHNLSQPWFLPL